MSLTLAQARTRVRKLIDDTDSNPANADADVDDALATAQIEAFQAAVAAGANLFHQEVTLTSSAAGLVDLTAQRPLKVRTVHQVVGSTRLQVLPGRASDVVQKVSGAQQVAVSLVQRPAFPAAAGDPFVWGTAAVENPLLDKLMCLIAASELWGNQNERPHAVLEARKAELKAALESTINIPSWTALPLRMATAYPINRNASFQWIMTAPHQMQLVYP